MRLCKVILPVLGMSILLSGCGQHKSMDSRDKAALQKLGAVTVCSREEGSGTRDVFLETLGISEQNNALKDEIICESNSEVLEYVADNTGAIGYISAGSVSNDARVQMVTSEQEISRHFYLAYSGKLNEVEEDFMTYIKSKGQQIVQKNYQPVNKETSFLSDRSSGTIKIGGSSSAAGLVSELADEYMHLNPNAVIAVVTTDSTDGLNGAMNGTYDLGMASRELKDYEKELLETVPIAKDEVKVIINSENKISCLSLEELYKIYSGSYTEWSNLTEE